MNAAVDAPLEVAAARGLELHDDGGRGRVRPREVIALIFIESIRQHRPEVIAGLRRRPGAPRSITVHCLHAPQRNDAQAESHVPHEKWRERIPNCMAFGGCTIERAEAIAAHRAWRTTSS